jgi:hypothetical protein
MVKTFWTTGITVKPNPLFVPLDVSIVLVTNAKNDYGFHDCSHSKCIHERHMEQPISIHMGYSLGLTFLKSSGSLAKPRLV